MRDFCVRCGDYRVVDYRGVCQVCAQHEDEVDGTIVGGVIGGIVAGPIGIVAGGLLGNILGGKRR